MLGKQAWRLLSQPESLIARILKARYYAGKSFLEAELGTNPSYTWRSILAARQVVTLGLRWQVGNGASIRIWSDPWIPLQPGFKVLSPRLPLEFDSVSTLIDEDTRSWKTSFINHIMMPSEVEQVLAIPLSYRDIEDRLIWHFSRDGSYTVKSAYAQIRKRSTICGQASTSSRTTRPWMKIWSLQIPNKIKLFVWRMFKGLIPVKTKLIDRGMPIFPECPRCGASSETLSHALFYCEYATQTWFLSPLGVRVDMLNGVEFEEWLWDVLMQCEGEAVDLACMVTWSIWNARNACLYEEVQHPPNLVVHLAMTLLLDFRRENATPSSNTQTQFATHWQPPAEGYLKLNTDAACREKGIGLGVICRNGLGTPVFLSARYALGSFEVKVAELLAIRAAVMEASMRGICNVIVESNSLLAIQAINNKNGKGTVGGMIVEDIIHLSSTFSNFRVVYSNRQTNGAAHALAKLAFENPYFTLSSYYCLNYIFDIVRDDAKFLSHD